MSTAAPGPRPLSSIRGTTTTPVPGPPRAPAARGLAGPRGVLGAPHILEPPGSPRPSPTSSPHLPRRLAPRQRPQARPASGRRRPGPGAGFAAHRGRALLHGLLRVLHLEEVAIGREDGDCAVVAHAGERRSRAGKNAHSPPHGPRLQTQLRPRRAAPDTAHCAAGVRRRAASASPGGRARAEAGPGRTTSGRTRGTARRPGAGRGARGGRRGATLRAGPRGQAVRAAAQRRPRGRRGGSGGADEPTAGTPAPPPPCDCGE